MKKNIFFGFTLVEMMVVVAVMMVLVGIGSVSLNKFNSNQNLDSRKEELMADFKLARNMAVTSQQSAVAGGSLVYSKVTLNGGYITTDVIVAVADSVGNTSLSTNNVSPSKKNESLNTINTSFGFSVENGRLTSPSGIFASQPVCLTLYLISDVNDKKFIYIDTSGLVYEKNSCN
ncbi:MAG: GspH/FimT family protein [Candidatus Shapirobacteria bacterium]|nr:GspH/FimT family protein [Candidatus Shapirobacteria bacterium]